MTASCLILFLIDIDDCAGQPCQNGATCIDAVNNYTCNCVDGYTGKNCSIGKNRVCLFQRMFIISTQYFSVLRVSRVLGCLPSIYQKFREILVEM